MSYIGNPIVSTDFPVDYKSGNGSTTAFTLSVAPASVNSIDVQISGVSQSPQTYSVSGTTLTFSAAPPSGTNNIVVRHLGIAGIPNVPATASVTSASLAAQDLVINGVTVGKGGGSISTNTGVGASALTANTTGSRNTAIGYLSGSTLTTGQRNAYYGAYAGNLNTGSFNTGIGDGALYASGSGNDNTAVGSNALVSNSSGASNTAVGSSALQANTTASNNTAVGYQAGYSNTTGLGNNFFGRQTGYSNTTSNYNTFIGDTAGYATTGANNTFIGAGAGGSVTSGAKNSILGFYNGNQGGLDIRTASNYIVLSDGDGNPRAYDNGNGAFYVGLGGTSSTDQGILILNSTSASGYGSAVRGHANGTAQWKIGSYSYFNGGTNQYLTCLNSSGGVYLNGASATAWTAVSDERLKENLVPITDALNKVCTLRTVIGNYTFDGEKSRKPFLIAQDVQAVLPEAVTLARQSKEDETEYLGVAYTETIPLLVKAIQELNDKVEAQALEIALLKAK